MLSKPVSPVLLCFQSYDFSANSIKYIGADPLLIDADIDLWQMDLDLLEEFLENETEQKNNVCYQKKHQ